MVKLREGLALLRAANGPEAATLRAAQRSAALRERYVTDVSRADTIASIDAGLLQFGRVICRSEEGDTHAGRRVGAKVSCFYEARRCRLHGGTRPWHVQDTSSSLKLS